MNWAEVQLIELLETLESGSRPKGGVRGILNGIPSVGGEHLNDNGGFDFSNIKYIPKSFAEKMNRGRIEEGDTLIVKDGATTGKTSYIDPDFPFKIAFVNEHVFICRPSKEIDSKYLFWFLRSKDGNERIMENFKGSAQGGINQTFASNTLVPLAPLAEQQRIVAKLDELMEKIDRSRARLERIPKILKRFRQSILSAAVNGKLSEEWREKHGFKAWEFKRAEDTCHLITKGTTPTNNGLTASGEIPYLKVYNIVDQKINFFYKPQYVSREIHNNFLKRSRVFPGDVLMNIVGPPLGKVAIVPDEFNEWNINQAIAFFRAKEMILPDFIYLILCEGAPINEIEKEYRGTAGQSNISLEQCRNFKFPIPEIEEQREIIRRVEQLLATADRIEARYAEAKAQFDKLPQSLLTKAFRGELVPQDENDEPASVLLERIKGEQGKSKLNVKSNPYELVDEHSLAVDAKTSFKRSKK